MKNIIKEIWILLVFIIFIPGLTGADIHTLKFSQIDKKQGLSSPYISGLCQDHQGFIWIGSYHSAVYRYDGEKIKTYGHDPADPSSMPATKYGQMYPDDSNVLWLATLNGLVALDLTTDTTTWYTHHPGDPESIPPGEITAIYEQDTEYLWLGMRENGLVFFHKETGKVVHYRHHENDPDSLASNQVLCLAEDSNGTLWVGTDAGACTFNRETSIFTRYQNDPRDPGSLSDNLVFSITLDKRGILWFATRNGLNALLPGEGYFRRYYLDDVKINQNKNSMLVYEGPVSGRLWIPVYGEGLFEFDREKEEFYFIAGFNSDDPESLSTDYINVIMEDRSGMLWIGGDGGFLNAAKLEGKGFHYLKNNPLDPAGFHGMAARAFDEDESGLIWVASLGGGLQVFHRQSGKIIRRYTHNPYDPWSIASNEVYSVLVDDSGVVWAGTRHGISHLDRTTGQFTNYNRDIPGSIILLEDSRGDIWAAGWTGLSRFSREEGRFVTCINDPDDPGNQQSIVLFDVYEDTDGNIMAATLGYGLLHYNVATEEFTFTTHDPEDPGSICTDNLFALLIDRRGELWVATNEGLDRYDRETDTFLHYTENDGLSSNTVYELVEDNDGNIWIITSAGLTRYDHRKNTFRSYDTSDGILGGDHFGKPFKSSDGFIFFSGAGINYFDPGNIVDNHYVPPVVMTGMKVMNRDVPVGEFEDGRCILTKPLNQTSELSLLSRDYIVFFEFSALNFIDPQKNQFAYIMEGFDEEWNYSGNRNFATYTNLEPGRYTFRVKGSNNDGKWNEEGVSLDIRVLPPYWKTWWFKIGISLLTLLLLAVFFIFLVSKMKARHKAQMKKQEIDIARHIQTSLLPDLDQFSDTGYDFDGNIIISESVGGDYYDILHGKDGRLWLGIGDVTGHGIPSGLIMMMAQVGIHNLLKNVPGITPEELLTTVNKILTNNIRVKMKSDHRLTINYLVEKAPGHFHYAGTREVILIHRAQTGEVIHLENGGSGHQIIEGCAAPMRFSSGEFTLEKNDTLLLYTNDLIRTMNRDREQGATNRLAGVMRSYCENPRVLKTAINKAVEDFGGIQKDDILYLICRRN